VSATRLLVVADQKMLSSLAAGLREGARFEVATAPLSDPNAAQAAATEAEAVALFYGGPSIVQALSSRVRDRGGRMVAVLQREQLPQRDDCFRAGASDLLFMPMPKDQFVNRLAQTVALAFETAEGTTADVAVVSRTATHNLQGARVVANGVEAPAEVKVKPGETVRLTFGGFQVWGLVARAEGPLQIRFAGLTADEEARIRKWVENGGRSSSSLPIGAVKPVPQPAGGAATPASTAALASPESGEVARAAPAAGPPPGFKGARPVAPKQPRPPPPLITPTSTPVLTPTSSEAATPAAAAAAPLPPAPAARTPPAPAVAALQPPEPGAMAELFDEGAVATEAPAPAGPPWPAPYSFAACKTAVLMLVQDTTAAPETDAAILASARKVSSGLGAGEREALQKAGSDSHFADALAARVALLAATAEGVALYNVEPAAMVDSGAFSGILKSADDAAARLQKEASAAVTKGEVETLQLITAASAALSRDLLSFKETADRLRGLAAAPRLGAGALDPDMAVPGQPARVGPAKAAEKQQQVRPELRDFVALDGSGSQKWKKGMLALGIVALVVLGINAIYFSIPSLKSIPADAAGKNVASIQIHGDNAIVVVNQEWLDNAQVEMGKLLPILRERNVVKAMLMTGNGRPAGVLNVQNGRIVGLPAPAQPKK
jgi:hypothetical protein